MSRQLRLEFPGAIWHVTSRGNEQRDISRDDADRGKLGSHLETQLNDPRDGFVGASWGRISKINLTILHDWLRVPGGVKRWIRSGPR